MVPPEFPHFYNYKCLLKQMSQSNKMGCSKGPKTQGDELIFQTLLDAQKFELHSQITMCKTTCIWRWHYEKISRGSQQK